MVFNKQLGLNNLYCVTLKKTCEMSSSSIFSMLREIGQWTIPNSEKIRKIRKRARLGSNSGSHAWQSAALSTRLYELCNTKKIYFTKSKSAFSINQSGFNMKQTIWLPNILTRTERYANNQNHDGRSQLIPHCFYYSITCFYYFHHWCTFSFSFFLFRFTRLCSRWVSVASNADTRPIVWRKSFSRMATDPTDPVACATQPILISPISGIW